MVSVIIPTYKERGGLKKSILSALNQENVQLEVIVVDDNAPDSDARQTTEQIMSEFKKDSRVIYIKHPFNKNGSAARNTGLKASNGQFIAFLDDDDYFLKGKLEKQQNFLENHQEYDAVYCLAGRNGASLVENVYEGNPTRDLLLLNTFMQTSCLMFRKESLEAINGFDESFRRHQDYEMLLRFFHKGSLIGCLPEVLTEMGVNNGENIPTGHRLEEIKSHFLGKFKNYIDEIDLIEKGFSKKVYAKHYAGVFLSHIKNKHLILAIKVFFRYFFKSPVVFVGVIKKSIKAHLK